MKAARTALRFALLLVTSLWLSACGTPYATMANRQGEPVMLLGHDPVAYFTRNQAVRGDPSLKSELPGRIYYFADPAHKRQFDADPARFEPQYAGFCASGAAFGIKLGSDPSEWEIVDGRLFIFGDILGRTAWKIDPAWNIARADEVWPDARDAGWRWQSLKRYAFKVPWYKDSAAIERDFAAKYPGQTSPRYNPGGMLRNLFLESPGWRAREGFSGQPALGLLGDDACPPACAGAASQGFSLK